MVLQVRLPEAWEFLPWLHRAGLSRPRLRSCLPVQQRQLRLLHLLRHHRSNRLLHLHAFGRVRPVYLLLLVHLHGVRLIWGAGEGFCVGSCSGTFGFHQRFIIKQWVFSLSVVCVFDHSRHLEGSSPHILDKGHLKQSLPLILYNIWFKVNNDNTCSKNISVIRREKTFTLQTHLWEAHNIKVCMRNIISEVS